MSFELRRYQHEAVQSVFDHYEGGGDGNVIIASPTGCHAKGTEILMYDGSIKLVEEVTIGDNLMGPDSLPRTVLNLARGNEEMVRVTPIKGDSFVVNKNHILSLYKLNERSIKSGRQSKCSMPAIKNVKIYDYMNNSKHFRYTHKLRRCAINFNKWNALSISPYWLGIYIGDGSGGSGGSLSFTSVEDVLLNEFIKELTDNGDEYSISTKQKIIDHYKDCKQVHIIKRKHSNTYAMLEELGLENFNSENVFVPLSYKTASREDRIQILSGLIDTDGHKCNGDCCDYITKSIQLSKDIVFIARSLGLAAYSKECQKSCQNNFTGTYQRISISGDLSILKCRIDYKVWEPRKQIKSVLVTGIKTELLEKDDFYGFSLTGDHLYLTSDFIVHHNTGKSIIIAALIQRILSMWANQRFLILTHVKELLVQNSEKLLAIWPEAPIGVYSAGLNQKDIMQPIIFGGVASVVNVVEAFGHRDLVIVDESHLISPKDGTMYQNVLKRLMVINPHMKVIGMTATPYRLGQGMITDDGIFDHICCDLTGVESFNRLIAEGFIAPLIPKRTSIEVDVSDLKIVNGDYAKGQSDEVTDRILYDAMKETVEQGHDRKSWLIFTAGIKTADHAAEILTSFGITAAAVHSKIPAKENDRRLQAFKDGKIQAICGMNKFTTGFDHPPIDLIAMLRPTVSPGLWVQMLGRGTRPSEASGKINCKVLDFAGNTRRLGPINDPKIPRKKGKATGEVPIKICELCGTYNHASARFCCNPDCEQEFKFQTKLVSSAFTDALMRSDAPVIEHYTVDRVIYHRHEKQGSPPMIKVSYFSGLRRFNEFVCLEHSGWAKKRARDWWRQRHQVEPPETTDMALTYVSQLRTPSRIRVWCNKKFPEIMGVEW